MVKIFNTLSDKKEPLKKPLGRKLKLFVCGPTVYNEIHLGNFRTYLSFDLIVRYLRSRGLKISYLQNITNIDDKIIQRAQELKMAPAELADKYEQLYYDQSKRLNITSVDKYARATDFIPQIIKQIKTLNKKGAVYLIPGDGWYFDLSTFKHYGELAKRTVAQADDGVTRVDNSDKKRNAGDFCVWKLSKPGEPTWETDLGAGRPGWHIEDTAITEKFFGPQYDIHGGARDLIFPHHEAEIALEESASGKRPFVKIWMHAGFLTASGEKMSKSQGNFVTLDELLTKHSADAFRYFVFQHHYRAPLDYTETAIRNAKKSFADIGAFLLRLNLAKTLKNKKPAGIKLAVYAHTFHSAMEDDFNTSKAIASIFDLMNEANGKMWHLSVKEASAISAFITGTFSALGFTGTLPVISEQVTQYAKGRELFRTNKQFIQADGLRKQVEALGYSIEDTPAGPLVLPGQN